MAPKPGTLARRALHLRDRHRRVGHDVQVAVRVGRLVVDGGGKGLGLDGLDRGDGLQPPRGAEGVPRGALGGGDVEPLGVFLPQRALDGDGLKLCCCFWGVGGGGGGIVVCVYKVLCGGAVVVICCAMILCYLPCRCRRWRSRAR